MVTGTMIDNVNEKIEICRFCNQNVLTGKTGKAQRKEIQKREERHHSVMTSIMKFTQYDTGSSRNIFCSQQTKKS